MAKTLGVAIRQQVCVVSVCRQRPVENSRFLAIPVYLPPSLTDWLYASHAACGRSYLADAVFLLLF